MPNVSANEPTRRTEHLYATSVRYQRTQKRIDIAINSDLLMKCRPLYISVSAMLEKSFNQHLAEHAASQQFR